MTYTIDMLIDKIKEVGKSYDLDKIQALMNWRKRHTTVFSARPESLILRTL